MGVTVLAGPRHKIRNTRGDKDVAGLSFLEKNFQNPVQLSAMLNTECKAENDDHKTSPGHMCSKDLPLFQERNLHENASGIPVDE
jgi:hypothetical protein